MNTPAPLQKGDLIAIASPARSIKTEELQAAIDFLGNQGFRVRIDDTVLAVENQFAGNDQLRAKHFQQLLDDPEVKAVLCSRGGYGSLRIIDHLNFDVFVKNPKWIAGYSDITVIHSHLLQLGVKSIHGTMPVNFAQNSHEALESLVDCLQGLLPEYQIPAHTPNKQGEACGKLVGGNLSILYSLIGSSSFPDTKGCILFLEDLDEYLYHVDRMILSLKRAGVFNSIAALVVGGMTKMNDNAIPFGKSAEMIIAEHVHNYDFPVCFGFPAGHIADNRALVIGQTAHLTVSSENVIFTYVKD